MIPRNQAALAVVALAAAVTMVPLTAGPAQAAPSCTGVTNITYPSDFASYMRMPSIGNGTGQLNCELGIGNSSAAVATLQESLIGCYHQSIRVDADFGMETQRAVRDAQRQINSTNGAGLAIDGRYGPLTRKYFTWKLYNSAQVWVGCGYYGA